jgi:hypothetical protein
MDPDRAALGKRLLDAVAEAMPAPQVAEAEYNIVGPEEPLDLIFLRFAEVRSGAQRAKLKAEQNVPGQINHH